MRIALGRHPRPHRERFPDLELVDLKPGAIVLDVGANAGDFSECVLAFQPWARLILIEPLAEAQQELQRKFGAYDEVEIDEIALGTEDGERDFNVCGYDQVSSFLEPGAASEARPYGIDFSRKERRTVKVRRLDHYLKERRVDHVDLLKLDVQGFELEVLRGAGGELDRIDWIYAEAAFQELYRGGALYSDLFGFLHARGFELRRMASFRSDSEGRLLECDMLFRRRNRRATGNPAAVP